MGAIALGAHGTFDRRKSRHGERDGRSDRAGGFDLAIQRLRAGANGANIFIHPGAQHLGFGDQKLLADFQRVHRKLFSRHSRSFRN